MSGALHAPSLSPGLAGRSGHPRGRSRPRRRAGGRAMIGVLRPAPHVDRLPAERIDPSYRRLRRRVFAGIFVGYAAYYLVRNNLALAIPDILREHPEYTKAQLGTALTGPVDRLRRLEVPDGLGLGPEQPEVLPAARPAAVVRDHARLRHWSRRSTPRSSLIIVLQTLNGWVQGMGWPPCGKTMVHWFSTKERGLTVSVWNVAHNVGGGAGREPRAARRDAVPRLGRQVLLQRARSPPAIAVGGRSSCSRTRRSRAACRRSRSTENDYPPDYSRRRTSAPSRFREIFFGHVLNNRYLWAIAVANAFVYFVRYGVVNWIPTYLETAKGFSFKRVEHRPGRCTSTRRSRARSPCGWVSDTVFQGPARARDHPVHGADAASPSSSTG